MPKNKKAPLPTALFTNAELDALELARSVLGSRKLRLLKELMGYDPESRTAYLMRKQLDKVDRALANFANWRLLMEETKE